MALDLANQKKEGRKGGREGERERRHQQHTTIYIYSTTILKCTIYRYYYNLKMYFWKEYVYILLYKKIMYGVYNFEEYLYIFLQGSKSIYFLCCAHIYSLLILWDWSIYRSKHSPAECSNSIYNVDANWYVILRHLHADKSYLNWTYMHSLQM